MFRWLGLLSLLLGLWLVMTLVQRQIGAGQPEPSLPAKAPAPQAVPQQYQKALEQALDQGQRRLDAAADVGH